MVVIVYFDAGRAYSKPTSKFAVYPAVKWVYLEVEEREREKEIKIVFEKKNPERKYFRSHHLQVTEREG